MIKVSFIFSLAGSVLGAVNEHNHVAADRVCFTNDPNKGNYYLYQGSVFGFRIDGKYYRSAEQFMMAQKVETAQDQRTLDKIMSTSDATRLFNLGKEVQGLDSNLWDSKSEDVVYQGNLAKFSNQDNTVIKKRLLGTRGKTLILARADNANWGAGISYEDCVAGKPYSGANKLGKVLMEVRSHLDGR